MLDLKKLLIKPKHDIAIFTIILLFSLVGLIASFLITTEKIDYLRITNYVPICAINTVFNCTSVMNSKEAELFGFPNSLIGLVCYSIVGTVALCFLLGNRYKKNFLLLFNLVSFIAFLFSYWLLSISFFKVGAICPFCVASCISATNIFFAITIYNLLNLDYKKSIKDKAERFINKGYFWAFIFAWYVLIIMIGYLKFETFFFG